MKERVTEGRKDEEKGRYSFWGIKEEGLEGDTKRKREIQCMRERKKR